MDTLDDRNAYEILGCITDDEYKNAVEELVEIGKNNGKWRITDVMALGRIDTEAHVVDTPMKCTATTKEEDSRSQLGNWSRVTTPHHKKAKRSPVKKETTRKTMANRPGGDISTRGHRNAWEKAVAVETLRDPKWKERALEYTLVHIFRKMVHGAKINLEDSEYQRVMKRVNDAGRNCNNVNQIFEALSNDMSIMDDYFDIFKKAAIETYCREMGAQRGFDDKAKLAKTKTY